MLKRVVLMFLEDEQHLSVSVRCDQGLASVRLIALGIHAVQIIRVSSP